MTDWDNLVEPTRDALEELLREGDNMAERIEELEAKLAEVGAERDHWETVAIARQAKQQAAEAALPAVYRLALEDAAERLLAAVTREYKDHRDYRKAIRALPTPTAAELMARIQTGEKE